VDARKLRSSATLFLSAGGGAAFRQVLETFFGGQPRAQTQALMPADRDQRDQRDPVIRVFKEGPTGKGGSALALTLSPAPSKRPWADLDGALVG
jgi:hypothetical protein